MRDEYSRVFIFFIISLNTVFAQESIFVNPSEEYLHVFKSIPTLFEYILDMLQEKPEILEKNDVTVFKRSADGYKNDDIDCTNEDVKTENSNYYDQVNREKEYVETENLINENKFQINNKREIDNLKKYGTIKNNDNRDKVFALVQQYSGGYDDGTSFESNDDANDKYLASLSHTVSMLTPDEVAEMTLMVEQKLEEYNSSN